MWGRGGKDYDEVSFANSDALARATQRLNARASEHIPDVAIGTGCSARNVDIHVERLLEKDFELKFEQGISHAWGQSGH